MGKVLIIDDSEDLLFSLSNIIKNEGYVPFVAETGTQALTILNNQIIDLVFLDIGLPDVDGMELISKIKNFDNEIEVVMLTGRNDAITAVQALKSGAIDYILKPFELIEFKSCLKRIMEGRLAARRAGLEAPKEGVENIIGESKVMQYLKDEIRMASEVNTPVLLIGETGTGKEVVARAIHASSGDKRGVFVKVDCGALAANVIESELFGYDKGAFTDARKDKKGLVEIADGGTLFLDEIGNLPLSLQPVLLRLIEESTFRRVGGLTEKHVNVRIIAATNVNIEEEVAAGRFREDLFYRLNVLQLHVPPLRERGNDVLLLADYFLKRFSGEMKKKIKGLTPEAEKAFLAYSWQGNVRELKNCIEREVIYCRGEWLSPSDSLLRKAAETETGADSLVPLADVEADHIKKVLIATDNNKSQAAKILNITRTTLREKLKKIG